MSSPLSFRIFCHTTASLWTSSAAVNMPERLSSARHVPVLYADRLPGSFPTTATLSTLCTRILYSLTVSSCKCAITCREHHVTGNPPTQSETWSLTWPGNLYSLQSWHPGCSFPPNRQGNDEFDASNSVRWLCSSPMSGADEFQFREHYGV